MLGVASRNTAVTMAATSSGMTARHHCPPAQQQDGQGPHHEQREQPADQRVPLVTGDRELGVESDEEGIADAAVVGDVELPTRPATPWSRTTGRKRHSSALGRTWRPSHAATASSPSGSAARSTAQTVTRDENHGPPPFPRPGGPEGSSGSCGVVMRDAPTAMSVTSCTLPAALDRRPSCGAAGSPDGAAEAGAARVALPWRGAGAERPSPAYAPEADVAQPTTTPILGGGSFR